ncbi:Gamma-glutamyl peptidase 5 [Linum grandiflorum]
MGGKKFGVLLCAEDSDYVKRKYGGYFEVFVGMLAEEGDSWQLFRVVAGEFPDDDELDGFDGFVITGSCNDAHSNDEWICRLLKLLVKLNSLKKKLLGICFGHQILGRAIGGKTGRNKAGWDIGIRSLHLSSSTSNLFTALQLPAALSIIECHRDEQVRELPAEAEVMAWSEKTGIEMFRYGKHMMGIQGHPEYNQDILFHLIDRLHQRNFILPGYADELKEKVVEIQHVHADSWKKFCIGFLKDTLIV